MSENVENMILEVLKKIQIEQSEARKRDGELLSRLAGIESGIARIGKESADTFGEVMTDRHAVDRLKERIERIERRLEIESAA